MLFKVFAMWEKEALPITHEIVVKIMVPNMKINEQTLFETQNDWI